MLMHSAILFLKQKSLYAILLAANYPFTLNRKVLYEINGFAI
jgi:hypothetical protein